MIDVQFCSIFSLFFIISTLLIRSIFNKPSRPTTGIRLPPSPPALPIIGHLHLLTPSLYKCFQILSAQYGPLLYLRFSASRCLLVSSASIATEIFKTHDLAFASRPPFAFAEKLQYGTSGFINAPYGNYWKFMKRFCVKELLGTLQLERSRPVRREEIERMLRRVMETARDKEAVIDIGTELMRLTNNTTCRMVMSTVCSAKDGEAERIIQLVKESFELAAKLCFGDVLGPLKKLGFWVYGKQAMDVTRRV